MKKQIIINQINHIFDLMNELWVKSPFILKVVLVIGAFFLFGFITGKLQDPYIK